MWVYYGYIDGHFMAEETPKFVTKKKRIEWQPYVSKMIRRYMDVGSKQIDAIDRALTLRDNHIKLGHKYRNGKIIK